MVEVSERAREAAADYADIAIRMIGLADKMRSGARDHDPLVQAFAKFEEETRRAAYEAVIQSGDIEFLKDLAARIFQNTVPAQGFDQGDTDQLCALANRFSAIEALREIG